MFYRGYYIITSLVQEQFSDPELGKNLNLTFSEKFQKLSAIKAETENYERYIPVHSQLQIKIFSACFQ